MTPVTDLLIHTGPILSNDLCVERYIEGLALEFLLDKLWTWLTHTGLRSQVFTAIITNY